MQDRERVLGRVEEDLARGHTHVAIQRLSTLVQGDPTDLDLRSRLAAVHLRTGNLVEAGRWSYLSDDRDPEAVAAFERAHQHPRGRLEALRWPPGHADGVPVPLEQVLQDVREAPRRRDSAGLLKTLALRLFLLVNLAAWVIGCVAVARWIL